MWKFCLLQMPCIWCQTGSFLGMRLISFSLDEVILGLVASVLNLLQDDNQIRGFYRTGTQTVWYTDGSDNAGNADDTPLLLMARNTKPLPPCANAVATPCPHENEHVCVCVCVCLCGEGGLWMWCAADNCQCMTIAKTGSEPFTPLNCTTDDVRCWQRATVNGELNHVQMRHLLKEKSSQSVHSLSLRWPSAADRYKIN